MLDIPVSAPPPPARPFMITSEANSWVPHDMVIRDAWFPVAFSASVGRKPLRRSVYSHPYFLWRDADGKPAASEFHPNARRADKSDLTDREGFYPVHEKYGYVWAWFGNPLAADPAHLPSIPYLPPNGGLPGYMYGTNRFDCAAPVSIENLVDLTHADFVHGNLIGDEKSDSEKIEVFSDSETLTMVRTCEGKSVAQVMKLLCGVREATQSVRQVVRVYLRAHCCIAYGSFRPGDDVPLFHPVVPETRDRSRMDFTMNMSHSNFIFRRMMPRASYIISRQDSAMTSPQSIRYMRETGRRDLHSRFDAAGQRYRMLMKEMVARQARGDFAYRDNVSADCSELIGLRKELFPYA